jgi:glutathione S-transferase
LDTRSFRVLWALEELSLLYELHVLPFPPRQLAKSIFDVNPLGTVPALVVDGTVVTESVAIVYYLDLVSRGEGSPLAVPPQEQDYGVWLIIKWLSFGGATLTFPQTIVLRYRRFEPGRADAAEDYERWFLGRLRKVETVLSGSEFICAGRFTAADISVGYALPLATHLALDHQFGPAAKGYWARFQERPAYRRAKAAQAAGALAETGVFP